MKSASWPREGSESSEGRATDLQRRELDLAGLGIILETHDPEWWNLLDDRFDPFLGNAPRCLEVRLESCELERNGGYESSIPRVSRDGNLIRLQSWYHAEANLESGRAWIRSPVHRAPVDHLLRQVLPLLVGDALLIHGAMLGEGDGAWVFAGPSGCGKSTLTQLLPSRAVAEEHCLLRRFEGRWQAHAMPFRKSRPGWYELRDLFLLCHGEQHSIRHLPETESLRRLAGETIWPAPEDEDLEKKWDLLLSLVADLEPKELSFQPSPDVWDVISEAATETIVQVS